MVVLSLLKGEGRRYKQDAEKGPTRRLLKNAQIQGASFDKLRINSPEE